MITADAISRALTLVLNGIVKDISVISIENAGGEFFRKVPTTIEDVTSTKRQYTFWLSENEGNTTITKLSFWGNGATTDLGTGTKYDEQIVVPSFPKDNIQSLTIYLELEAVS